MKILITGGGGFLGSALANKFVENNFELSLLIRKKTKLNRINNKSAYNIGICESDEEIYKFINSMQPDIVIHTACCYGRLENESILQMVDSNIRYGTIILEALKDQNKEINFINSGTALSNNSIYSLTKRHFEDVGAYICKSSNKKIKYINIKLHNIYGPNDNINKFPTLVIESCRNGVAELKITHGEQIRDFIYIDDVVEAYDKIVKNLPKINLNQEIEIGSGIGIRRKDFVEVARKLTNSKTKILYGFVPSPLNDEMHLQANNSYLKSLNWRPKYDVTMGIKKILDGIQVK